MYRNNKVTEGTEPEEAKRAMELSERVLERLKNMSDEEFAGIEFVVAE